MRKRPWPKDVRIWKHATMLGVFGTTMSMTCVVSSLQYLSSGVASILITANPALTILFAHFALPDERLTIRKTIGVVFALGGAAILAMRGESGIPGVIKADPIGYVLIAVGMVSGSTMLIYARKYMKDLDAFDVTSVRMVTASLAVIPIVLIFSGLNFSKVDEQGILALLYASVFGTFFGIMVQFYNVKRFGATAAVLSAYLIPVFATIGGALVLNETITLGILSGLLLIAIGIYLISR